MPLTKPRRLSKAKIDKLKKAIARRKKAREPNRFKKLKKTIT